MKRNKAFTVIEVILAVAIIGGVATFLFPKVFNKDSRLAAHSQQATQQLEQATNNQSAEAAGSVAAIGRMNDQAPASPQKNAIAAEIPVALSKMNKPDPVAEAAAWKRMAAVAEGRAELAESLYATEASHSKELQKQVDDAKAYREKADLQLSEAAAYKLWAERTKLALGAVAAVLLLGLAYVKIYGISPSVMGKIVADIRQGANPITAIDTNLGPRLHSSVQTAARLATPSV